jgi:DNA-directed RNA polymerase subunit RPC12/RpoP
LTIEFSCSHCNKVLKTSDDKAGRRAKCPQCGESITVPLSDVASHDGFDGFDEFDEDAPVREEQSFLADTPVREEDSFLAAGNIDCPMCGASIQANAKICQYCGETLQVSGRSLHRWEPRIINVGDVFSRSWGLYKENLGMCIAAPILGNILAYVASIAIYLFFIVMFFVVAAVAGQNNQAVIIPAVILFYLAAIAGVIIVSMFFQLGMQTVLLQIAQGRNPGMGELFSGGPLLWRMVACSLLLGIAVMVGTLLLVIPGIILLLMFWPYSYVLIDRKLPGIDSFSEARNITRGNLLTLTAIFLLIFVIYFVGTIITLGIGAIFVLPFCMLVMSVAYAEMTSQ